MRPLALVAALIALLAVSFNGPIAKADDPNSLVDNPAPAFSLTGTDGKTYTLADQKGHVVVVDFWATWCGPCRASLPHIQQVSADADLAKKGLVVWAVNDREDKDTIQKFKDDNHYTFTTPMDSGGSALESYKVHGIPTTVIIGADGNVKAVFVGFDDTVGGQINDAIKKALADAGK